MANEGGIIELQVDQMFQPKTVLGGADERLLGCMCARCEIFSANAVVDLLEQAKGVVDAS